MTESFRKRGRKNLSVKAGLSRHLPTIIETTATSISGQWITSYIGCVESSRMSNRTHSRFFTINKDSITSKSGRTHLSVVAGVARHMPRTRDARWRLLKLRSFNRRGIELLNFCIQQARKKPKAMNTNLAKKMTSKSVSWR